MADQVMDFKGRPCLVTGTAKAYSQKFQRHFDLVLVRYLDGQEPLTAKIAGGKFKAAKRINGGQALAWRRTDELIRQGMEGRRARTQAMDELGAGLLAV